LSDPKIAPPTSIARGLTSRNADAARGRSRHKSGQYLVAADAPATVRAYTADWRHFSLWCAGRGLAPMPASPQLVGDYLSDLGEGYARATLRRKVAAIARANRHAGHRLDTGDPSIRDVLRGFGRTHGSPPKRAQALATEEVRRLVATCPDDPAGLPDRALILIAFAGALRRSELCAVEVEHITWKPRSLELLIPRSKTDAEAEGARIGIPRGKAEDMLFARNQPVRGRAAGPAGRALDSLGDDTSAGHQAQHLDAAQRPGRGLCLAAL